MGSDENAVLDPELRVRGVGGLRVVDASAMPDLVSAHINACVLMMGEKASDMIRFGTAPAQQRAVSDQRSRTGLRAEAKETRTRPLRSL